MFRFELRDGYLYDYLIVPGHPRANGWGAVNLHTLVCEQKLGRLLKHGETVHHIDENKKNNDPSNLMVFATHGDHARFHMYNCDESLLSKNEDGVFICKEILNYCKVCGVVISPKATWCKSCAPVYSDMYKRKVERPTAEELYEVICSYDGNFTQVAKLYGVTDNGVRKWCRGYKIPSHSKDYK